MDGTVTVLKPECLARAGAIPCRNCGTCRQSAGNRVPEVAATERERIAGEHFRRLRGASGVDAAVTAGARERIAHDHANASRRRQHVICSDAAVAALKRQWNLNRPNENGVLLQDEFGGDEEAFIAFAKLDAAGHVTIHGRGAPRGQPRPDSASLAELDTTVLRRAWDANLAIQAEFGDFEAYSAYHRAVARGAVRLVVNSPGVTRG